MHKNPVVSCQARAITFTSLQLEHRLGAGQEETFGFSTVREAVHHRDVGNTDQVFDLTRAFGRHRPSISCHAGVSAVDFLGVMQRVVTVDLVNENNTRFSMAVGIVHDHVPHLAGLDRFVDPETSSVLVRFCNEARMGLGLVHKFPVSIFFDSFHELVSHRNGNVEVVPAALLVFGLDEGQDVRMVVIQHTHLGTATRTQGLDGRAGGVKDVHVAAGTRGHGLCGLNPGAVRTHSRKVVANTAAHAHGFSSKLQRRIDARQAVFVEATDRIADRLHKAVPSQQVTFDNKGLGFRLHSAEDVLDALGVLDGRHFG